LGDSGALGVSDSAHCAWTTTGALKSVQRHPKISACSMDPESELGVYAVEAEREERERLTQEIAKRLATAQSEATCDQTLKYHALTCAGPLLITVQLGHSFSLSQVTTAARLRVEKCWCDWGSNSIKGLMTFWWLLRVILCRIQYIFIMFDISKYWSNSLSLHFGISNEFIIFTFSNISGIHYFEILKYRPNSLCEFINAPPTLTLLE